MKKLIGIALTIAALAFTGVAQAETIDDKAANIAGCPDLVPFGQQLQQLASGGLTDITKLKNFYGKENDLLPLSKMVLDNWVDAAAEGGKGYYEDPTDMLFDCYIWMFNHYGWE